jgi:hypothetical protein
MKTEVLRIFSNIILKTGGGLLNQKTSYFDSSAADTAWRNSYTHQTHNSDGRIHKMHGWETSFKQPFRRTRLDKENA